MASSVSAAAFLLCFSLFCAVSSDTIPLLPSQVTGYRLPSIFAINDGKPFYLDKDPVTGAVDFTAGGKEVAVEPIAAESSSVASEATAVDEDEEEIEEEEGEAVSPAAASGDRGGATASRPLQAAPVVEEVEEDEPPPPSRSPVAPNLPKDQIDRKDTAATVKDSGSRPNDIQGEEEGDNNPYFHQFLNLNVHEYGDRIPGASSIRDEPYSFGSLGVGTSPLERGYKFPLISSSYANTKVQGTGGNYYYGDKGNQNSKDKDKEKYKPGYTGPYTTSSTRRPAPSYYHENEKEEDDRYYGRPSTSSASSTDDEEEEDHKYSAEGSSHYHGDRDAANEEEEEGEEEGESVDELVEEVSDHERPPVHPKRPQGPNRQPPKINPSTAHHPEEAEEEDYHDERPSYYGGTGFGGKPAGDKPRPTQQQNTYYYGNPAEEEEEEEEVQQDGPVRKPATYQGAHRGEEDRPRPSQAEEEEVDEEEVEGEEGGESNVKESPPPLKKPTLSYLGFGSEYDKDSHGNFGEKIQGSQKVEKPDYKYGYQGPPQEFHVDGYYSSSDREGPQKKPSAEAVDEDDSETDDVRPQSSNEGPKKEVEEEEEEEEETESRPHDTRRPSSPPQVVRLTPAQSAAVSTERPTRPYSQATSSTPSVPPTRETYHRPTYPSPYGLEEPFRPIYGPEESNAESFARPVQAYPQQQNKNQQYPSSVRPPFQSSPSPDPRPSDGQHYDNYFPLRPVNVNELPQKKKETTTPETSQKEPIASTYKPQYDTKTKKPIDQGNSPWKVDVSDNSEWPLLRPTQEVPKEIAKEQVRPTQKINEDTVAKRPSTLPPPPFREVVGIGSVGEPEYVKPTHQTSYGPFRFPDQEYVPQRLPSQQPLFLPRPSANNGATINLNQPPPPFGLAPPNGQRPVLPPSPSPILRPQGIDSPPTYNSQRPQGVAGAAPPPPPPRRWEERPVHAHPNTRPPPPQNFLHRPRPQEPQQPINPQQTGSHPYKFVSRKPGQEPVLMGSAPNAVFGNDKKVVLPPNVPKAQAPDPNLPNILPQFRPNAKISYSTIQREKGPYSPPPPPPQFGPNQRVSNVPERPVRPVATFYENLQPPPPPNNMRLHRIQGPMDEIPYGPPQIYPFGPGGSPPVGRRSGQQHQARVGDEAGDTISENTRKRPQVTTLQMMRNGLLDHQAARHPIISREDVSPKSTANPPPEILAQPTIYVTPDEGSTSASLSVDSSASEDHPVFVVYPVSDSSHQEDGVVLGTRGSQKPLPPSSIATEEAELSVLPIRPNVVNSDFPYPLVRPISSLPVKSEPTVAGPFYSLVQEEVPKDRVKENSDFNIIPYIQDYSPYATKKPLVLRDGAVTSATTEAASSTTSLPTTMASPPEKMTTKAPLSIVSAWQPDSEVEVSATMHAAPSGVPVNHRPLVEDKTEASSPSPLNFQAPFLASENIEPSPDSGWSAVGGSTSTIVAPEEASPSISRSETNSFSTTPDTKDNDSDSSDNKFDFDNFKPQLFGGFKPIYSISGDDDFKYASGTTERQER